MNKTEFVNELLRRYAEECQTMARSTSDLSPLESWLIMKLWKIETLLNREKQAPALDKPRSGQ